MINTIDGISLKNGWILFLDTLDAAGGFVASVDEAFPGEYKHNYSSSIVPLTRTLKTLSPAAISGATTDDISAIIAVEFLNLC